MARVRCPECGSAYPAWTRQQLTDVGLIALGMAAGHLRQVRTDAMVAGKRRDANLRWLADPPTPVLRLEHLQCACDWLVLAAREKAAS